MIDEEKAQSKALIYLQQVIQAVSFTDHDFCHTYWNIFKRSVSRAKLDLALMKATICCDPSFGIFSRRVSLCLVLITPTEKHRTPHLGIIVIAVCCRIEILLY